MATGECLAYSRLSADLKVKFAAWPMSWWPPGTDRLSLRGPKVNSCIWLRAMDDGTINIVLCIIIIIIIIIITVCELNKIPCFMGCNFTVGID